MRIGHLAAVAAVLVVGAAFTAPRPAAAAPGLVVGAVEDDVRASTLVEAEAKMVLFRLAGFPCGPRDDLLDARARRPHGR